MAVLGLRFRARALSSCGKRGHSSSRCVGLSLSRPLLLRSTGSRRAGSAIVAHGPSRSTARGILPDQGLNPCPLHWQADYQPLCHQGSPYIAIFDLSSELQSCISVLGIWESPPGYSTGLSNSPCSKLTSLFYVSSSFFLSPVPGRMLSF